MKTKLQYLPLVAALAFTPLLTTAAEETTKPGKASDAVKEPAMNPASKSYTAPAAKTGTMDAGKSSDAVHEQTASMGSKYHGKITAVDKDAMTVTFADEKGASQSVHIGDTTKIKKGDSEAKWADLKVGNEIHGTWKQDGAKHHAETVAIGKKE